MDEMNNNSKIIDISDLRKKFRIKSNRFFAPDKFLKAVDGVSLSIYKGEILGLVGESGCGKTTIGRLILGLLPANEGEILFRDYYNSDNYETIDIVKASSKIRTKIRQKIQIVFQDPYSSLNPRMKISQILNEPLIIQKKGSKSEREYIVKETIQAVALSESVLKRYPNEFSGGQRQRIAIARALVTKPDVVVADEAVSALDVSVQAQILKLLGKLKKDLNLTYLFISHDLSVVKQICTRIAVMYLGEIVEIADTNKLFVDCGNPYTEALISAIPVPIPNYKYKRIILKGDIPNPIDPPKGCKFSTRCNYVQNICIQEHPGLRRISNRHWSRCHLSDSLRLAHL